MRVGRGLVAGVAALGITLSSAVVARADEPAPGPQKGAIPLQIVDATLVRPVLLVGALATTALFLAVSPILSLTGTSEEATTVLLRYPHRYVSGRPLGNFTQLYPLRRD